jgi:DNA-binding CsgD family transcriptional regulator
MPKLFLEERTTKKASSFEYPTEDRVRADLTPREQEVLEIVVKGLNQREAGEVLGISSRTIEVHKRRIMAKFSVSSVPELIRLVLKGDRPKRELRG